VDFITSSFTRPLLFHEFPGARVTQLQEDQFQGSGGSTARFNFQFGILVDKNAEFHRSQQHNWRGAAARHSMVNAPQCGGATMIEGLK
jgi:hypothetical protein